MLLFLALFSTFAHAETTAGRELTLAAAHGSFYFSSSASEEKGCTVTLAEPGVAKILSESETHFEVEWANPPKGCYFQTWFRGLNLKHGFVRKDELVWKQEGDEDLPIPASKNAEATAALAPPKVDCVEKADSIPDPETTGSLPTTSLHTGGGLNGIGSLISALRTQYSGVKASAQIDQYMECYPYGEEGVENYQRLKKYVNMAAEHFRLEAKGQVYEVNPALMACLFRRESGYDPKNASHTDAVGLGQHTSINVKDISQRLAKKGSWEYALWSSFFERVKKDPAGRKLMLSCMGTSKTGEPVFNSKEDAKCPLQSIAASSIYNLNIQRELVKSAKVNFINWEDDLQYQLAIAAAHNLGNGASRKAVQDLFLGGWLKSILKKSPSKEKKEEVANHINAIRNCMQANNWKPMVEGDRPKCASFPGGARAPAAAKK